MTATAHIQSTPSEKITAMAKTTAAKPGAAAQRALMIGGWANLGIAAAHLVGLLWAWSMFRAVGIEEDMRELAKQGAALPYVLTLITAAAFSVFALYGLSGAGVLRRLPILRGGLALIATIYLYRATWGAGAIADGDGAQIAFAAIALGIGLCYARGVLAQRQTLELAAPARNRSSSNTTLSPPAQPVHVQIHTDSQIQTCGPQD